MKKFFDEFKEFALKGNVMDMAVGVIIGAAFGDIVTSLTENFIHPIINCIGGSDIGGAIEIGDTGNYIRYGAFISSVINFVIMAFILFLIIKSMNKLMAIGKKPEAPAAPTTKTCPYCKSDDVHIEATKCPHCGSTLE